MILIIVIGLLHKPFRKPSCPVDVGVVTLKVTTSIRIENVELYHNGQSVKQRVFLKGLSQTKPNALHLVQ